MEIIINRNEINFDNNNNSNNSLNNNNNNNKNNKNLNDNDNNNSNNNSNNNNNNNKRFKFQNKPIIVLPIYLQRFILKIMISEVCRKDKNQDYYKSISSEKRYKCKLLNLALTCKEWFKTISKNFFVANDFSILNSNYNSNSKYSLLKIENIRVLRLTQIYSKEYCLKIQQQLLPKLENLKKVILTSTFTNTDDKWYSFGNDIPLIENYKIDINVDIHDIYEIQDNITLNQPQQNSINTTNINLNVSLLNIWSDFDEECELVALNYINYFKPKKLLLFPTTNIIQFSKGYELFNNCLLSFKELNYYEPITIDELYHLLKSSPKIKYLSFQICFDTLIYYLSGNNNNANAKGTTCCTCNTSRSIQEFNEKWLFIYNTILNHKYLTSLSITHRCPESFELNQFYTGSYQSSSTSISREFIENFGSMILNNQSIKSLRLSGFHTPSLFEYVMANKRIIKYKSEFIDTLNNSKYYIDTISNLLKINPTIIKFHLHEISFTGDYIRKNYLTFKCFYNKSIKN
ncbi:hypothetical protein ACTFIW_012741 [Dictyostelium discoideum]